MSHDHTMKTTDTMIVPGLEASGVRLVDTARRRFGRVVTAALRQPRRAAAWGGGALAVTVLLALVCGGSSGIERPADAARSCFAALQSGDFDQLAPMACIEEDVESMVDGMDGAKRVEALDEVEKRGGFEATAKEACNDLRETFELVRKEGAEQFSWNDARFDTAEVKYREAKDGLPEADITAVIVVGDQHYRIVMRRCLRAPRGWICRRLDFEAL
ncbi:MAG: hypothetical protein CMJ83_09570 [Planctomycetes bacterium]|nr:hypothetical protein [Planctomycetota bacterium]